MPLWTVPGPSPEAIAAEREVLAVLGLAPDTHAIVHLGKESHAGGRITLVHRTTGTEYAVVALSEQWQRIVDIMNTRRAIVVDRRRRPEQPNE